MKEQVRITRPNSFIPGPCLLGKERGLRPCLHFVSDAWRSSRHDSVQPHGLQHTRLPYPSPTPRACWSSSPSNPWCHPTISSSVISFSSGLHSLTASESFPMSQFFASGGQSTGVSATTSVLLVNNQDWFPLGLTGLISLQVKGLQESSLPPQFKSINSSVLSFLYGLTISSIYGYWKNLRFDIWTFGSKLMSLLFDMLSGSVMAFLPWSKWLSISWLQSASAVMLKPTKIKSVPLSTVSPSICHNMIGPYATTLIFWMLI